MEPSKAQLEGLTLQDLDTTIQCDDCDVVVDLADTDAFEPEGVGWFCERRRSRSPRDPGEVTMYCPRCRVAEETRQATVADFGGRA